MAGYIPSLEEAKRYIESVLEEHDAHEGPIVLTVYEKTQGYGGPEEGGWWYDCGEPLQHVFLMPDDEQIEAALDYVAKEYGHLLEGREYTSAAGGSDLQVTFDVTPGQSYPEHRPRYE